MTDLRTRFRTFDELHAPELWHEAERRAAVTQPRAVRLNQWVFITVVLLLALLAGAVALIGSRTIRLPLLVETTSMPSTPANLATPALTPLVATAPTWTATGSMIETRSRYTATLLANGKVLVAGGGSIDGGEAVASAELYDPATGAWTSTGAMLEARGEGYTATLLPDGKVLVVGGYDRGGLASAEVYDPNSGKWTATGSMDGVRFYHTATLLPDGTVLVAGGEVRNNRVFPSAELYDPRTGSWTATGRMRGAFSPETATLLLDGTVLTVGGIDGRELAYAELYDPPTGTWSVTGSLSGAHAGRATLLPDGKVLVAGGASATKVVEPDIGGPAPGALTLASAELYDPRTGTWTVTGSMTEARLGYTATLLADGTVLVAGGHSNDTSGTRLLASAELYDPTTGSWALTAGMLAARTGHTATLLPNGTVLVIGGSDSALVELYVPGKGS
ncbi:MAG TPA: kelch repeat-containing protein [Patescibacteria group bacterium]|nr:kelch repeat-containing protein [Patescibacteria group bacterium]